MLPPNPHPSRLPPLGKPPCNREIKMLIGGGRSIWCWIKKNVKHPLYSEFVEPKNGNLTLPLLSGYGGFPLHTGKKTNIQHWLKIPYFSQCAATVGYTFPEDTIGKWVAQTRKERCYNLLSSHKNLFLPKKVIIFKSTFVYISHRIHYYFWRNRIDSMFNKNSSL